MVTPSICEVGLAFSITPMRWWLTGPHMCLVLGNVHTRESVPPWAHGVLIGHLCCHRCLRPWITEVSHLTQPPLSHYRWTNRMHSAGRQSAASTLWSRRIADWHHDHSPRGAGTPRPPCSQEWKQLEIHTRHYSSSSSILFLSVDSTCLSFSFHGCSLPLSSSCSPWFFYSWFLSLD